MKTTPLFGGALIVAGTTLGAGLLAVPITSAYFGFTVSAALMIIVCLVMTYSALLGVEINLYFKESTNIALAAEKILGPWAKSLSTAALVVLHYALLAAYASGGASILKATFHALGYQLNTIFLQISFTLSLALFILIATKAVDYLNRFLFIFKVAFFLILIAILLPIVNTDNLSSNFNYFIPFYSIIPVFITSFGYHGSIHSVVKYVGPQNPKTLVLTFTIGSLIALAFYLIWQLVTIGSLPLFGPVSFENVFKNNNDVGTFIDQLNQLSESNAIQWASNGFAGIAIATSFLGVGLGLFDFFHHKTRDPQSRLKPAALTFIIPLIFAIFYPQGFIAALGFAGVALSIIAILIPAMIVLKLRKQANYNPSYITPGGRTSIIILFIIGIGIVLCEPLQWMVGQ